MKIELGYKKKVEMELLKKLLHEITSNGSASTDWIIQLIVHKISRISGINIPRKVYSIQEILSDIVNEMFSYGHFMSKDRAEELIDKIKNL